MSGDLVTMVFSNRALKVVSLVDQVYDNIRMAIIRGDYAEGARIVEMEISERMGISQGTVRDALQRLDNDGLVERRARSATYVSTISFGEIFDLLEIRHTIEVLAMRRTAQQITAAQVAELQALADSMRAAAKAGDLLSMVSFDIQFHKRICEWSHNRGLLRSWIPLFSQIQRFKVRYHRHFFSDLEEIADLHQPMVDALRANDVDLAVHLLEEHIAPYNKERIREALAEEQALQTAKSQQQMTENNQTGRGR